MVWKPSGSNTKRYAISAGTVDSSFKEALSRGLPQIISKGYGWNWERPSSSWTWSWLFATLDLRRIDNCRCSVWTTMSTWRTCWETWRSTEHQNMATGLKRTKRRRSPDVSVGKKWDQNEAKVRSDRMSERFGSRRSMKSKSCVSSSTMSNIDEGDLVLFQRRTQSILEKDRDKGHGKKRVYGVGVAVWKEKTTAKEEQLKKTTFRLVVYAPSLWNVMIFWLHVLFLTSLIQLHWETTIDVEGCSITLICWCNSSEPDSQMMVCPKWMTRMSRHF